MRREVEHTIASKTQFNDQKECQYGMNDGDDPKLHRVGVEADKAQSTLCWGGNDLIEASTV